MIGIAEYILEDVMDIWGRYRIVNGGEFQQIIVSIYDIFMK